MKKTVKDLRPAPYNPRKITREKLDSLGASMDEFGDISGIVVNILSGNMVGGHQRSKKLSNDLEIVYTEKAAEGQFLDETGTTAWGFIVTPRGRWTYREVSWSEKKEKMANIRANRPGGEFDFNKVTELLVEINDGELDLTLTGFDERELQVMVDIPAKEQDEEQARGAMGEKVDYKEVTFVLTHQQSDEVKAALRLAKAEGPFKKTGNMSSDGNALARVCESFKTTRSEE